MLEFTIRSISDSGQVRQIGQLQFDEKWSTDEVIAVLEMFISRELRKADASAGFKSRKPAPPDSRESVTEAKDRFSLSDLENFKANALATGAKRVTEGATRFWPEVQRIGAKSEAESREVLDGVEVLDPYATGKKVVMRLQGKAVTGNAIAGLVAIHNSGRRVVHARDIMKALDADGRFESTADDAKGASRHILRQLTRLGLVEERPNGARALTTLGTQLAEKFRPLPKQ